MKNIKVLIANDDFQLVGALEYRLQRTFEVITSYSKEETAQVAANNPDTKVILIDKDCLGDGGIITILRGACPECKIILFSGGVLETEEPTKYGVDAVMNSSSANEIVGLIHDLLEPCTEDQKP